MKKFKNSRLSTDSRKLQTLALKLLKKEEFQNRIRAIVVDEAHLVVDWYVHLLNVIHLLIKSFML